MGKKTEKIDGLETDKELIARLEYKVVQRDDKIKKMSITNDILEAIDIKQIIDYVDNHDSNLCVIDDEMTSKIALQKLSDSVGLDSEGVADYLREQGFFVSNGPVEGPKEAFIVSGFGEYNNAYLGETISGLLVKQTPQEIADKLRELWK